MVHVPYSWFWMAYPGYKPDVAKAKQRQEFPEDAKSEWMKELRQLSESRVKSADGKTTVRYVICC